MSSSRRKDTISQLNNTISTQNEASPSLREKMRNNVMPGSKGSADRWPSGTVGLPWKTRLFGSTSETRHEQLQGQLDQPALQTEDEPSL